MRPRTFGPNMTVRKAQCMLVFYWCVGSSAKRRRNGSPCRPVPSHSRFTAPPKLMAPGPGCQHDADLHRWTSSQVNAMLIGCTRR